MEAICDKGKRSNGIPCEALGLCESMIKKYEPTMSSTKKKRTSMTRRIIILAERDSPMAALKKERKDATSFLIRLRPLGDRLPVAQSIKKPLRSNTPGVRVPLGIGTILLNATQVSQQNRLSCKESIRWLPVGNLGISTQYSTSRCRAKFGVPQTCQNVP